MTCGTPRDYAILQVFLQSGRLSLAEERQLGEREALLETLPAPPDFGRGVDGDGPGFFSRYFGARPQPDATLEWVPETYFAWPTEISSALSWIAREAGEGRELHHYPHLTTSWRRRLKAAASRRTSPLHQGSITARWEPKPSV